MQGSLRYSIVGADRWPRHTASQRSHRVLRAGDAQGDAALWRRGDPDVACQGRARGQGRDDLSPAEPYALRGSGRDRVARHSRRRPAALLPAEPFRSEGCGPVPRRMVQVSRLGGQHLSERSKTVMTATHAAQLVGEYLQRLERELTDLPLDTRNEIIDEIRRHIAEESGGLSDESDAALLNLLERLGDPADIAAAARGGEVARTSVVTTRLGTLEV